jgi:hypothetical protein
MNAQLVPKFTLQKEVSSATSEKPMKPVHSHLPEPRDQGNCKPCRLLKVLTAPITGMLQTWLQNSVQVITSFKFSKSS